MFFKAIAGFYVIVAAVHSFDLDPSQSYNHSTTLDRDGNYKLFWDFNDTSITFEVHVRTRGYIGFGISTSGKMFPADVVVGWVKDGNSYFADYHTIEHVKPVKDAIQNWHLIEMKENDEGTMMKFHRKLDTCDTEDEIIEDGTIRLIYSYNQQDPSDESSLFYHGTTRGTKSISLLSQPIAPSTMPSRTQTVDFLMGNFMIPNEDTRYQCRGLQMPNLGGKHHILKFQPLITPGNERYVHHMVLNRCNKPYPNYNGKVFPCYKQNRPKDAPRCSDIYLIWAVGGQDFYFPEEAALPIGHGGSDEYYVLEIHYDNPTLQSGIIDNSGFRFTVTSDLRPADAGILVFGESSYWHEFIPPREKAFTGRGYCPESCINMGLDQINETEVTAFGYFQHEHLIGRGVLTRHFRNGTELPPIANDPHYDFNFQESRLFKQEKKIKKGDSFIVECLYDSSEKANVTYGGLSTREEMCYSMIYYYPAMPAMICVSSNTLDALASDEKQMYRTLHTADWSDPLVKSGIMAKVEASNTRHVCSGVNLVPEHKIWTYKEKRVAPYVAPVDSVCQKAASSVTPVPSANDELQDFDLIL